MQVTHDNKTIFLKKQSLWNFKKGGSPSKTVKHVFLYNLIMQNLNLKKKFKIQENINVESLKDCSS